MTIPDKVMRRYYFKPITTISLSYFEYFLTNVKTSKVLLGHASCKRGDWSHLLAGLKAAAGADI